MKAGIGHYEAVAVGVSAGGLAALGCILSELERDLPFAILIVQHMRPDSDGFFYRHLDSLCRMRVKEAEDKETIEQATVYIAPPDYHLLVENDRTLTLSADERINYSRPSIDVLFETAAEAYQKKLVGLVLTGANADGSQGLARIKQLGGLAVVQSPASAECDIMPRAAITSVAVDHIVPLEKIGQFLNSLASGKIHGESPNTAGR